MIRALAVVLLLAASAARADQTLGAFYDPARQLPIFEHNWFKDVGGGWRAFGFNEFYHEPNQGFPPNSNVLFGKTWLMRSLSRDVSVGAELEHGYNNAGMWTSGHPFKQDQFRVIPKFGVQIRLP